jgi:hypothetical protein
MNYGVIRFMNREVKVKFNTLSEVFEKSIKFADKILKDKSTLPLIPAYGNSNDKCIFFSVDGEIKCILNLAIRNEGFWVYKRICEKDMPPYITDVPKWSYIKDEIFKESYINLNKELKLNKRVGLRGKRK